MQAKQINHGQSEIWLETDGQELNPRRILAMNEVLNVSRKHCPNEIFDAFCKQYRIAGQVASLAPPHSEDIPQDLKLAT